MILIAATLLTLTLALSGFSMATDDAEAVARAFLRAAYSHDAADFNVLVSPRAGASPATMMMLLASER